MGQIPLVSVIVPTYHREEPLYRALESIAKQTYRNCEAVVIDDNADINWNLKVTNVVAAIKNQYPDFQIVFIQNAENKGSAETRNIGIQAANGEYVTFLDDDDIYLPKKIERQFEDMRVADADYGITDLELYRTDEKLIQTVRRSYIKAIDQDSLLRDHLKYHLTGTDTLMFRKKYLIQIGMFPPINVGDEFYLMERAIMGGGKICYSPHCYIKAYVHKGAEEGLSSGEGKIKGENALYEMKKSYFFKLPAKDVRYIKVRHHMVIAFAEYRRKHWLSFIKHAMSSLFISPVYVFRIIKERL